VPQGQCPRRSGQMMGLPVAHALLPSHSRGSARHTTRRQRRAMGDDLGRARGRAQNRHAGCYLLPQREPPCDIFIWSSFQAGAGATSRVPHLGGQ
jgi:hypothetical protein